MKRVKCISGIEGWQDKLQNVYGSLDEFRDFASTWGLHKRLGFASPKDAWEANPVIQGSTNPMDFRCVELIKEAKRVKKEFAKIGQHFELIDCLDQLKIRNGKIITN
jgi:hypothetical protein